MSKALAQGTKLEITTGSPDQEVKGLTSFETPASTRTEIDTTTLDSSQKEFKLGLEDGGSITFNGIWDPDDQGQQDIKDARGKTTADSFKITLADGTSPGTEITFDAFINDFQVTGNTDAEQQLSFTLRVTGSVTWT